MILVIFRRIWGALKPFYKKIVFDNIFAIAGQSAFFLILSAVPLLMFSVSVLQSLHLSTETLGDFLGDTYSSTQVSEWFKSLNDMYTAPTSISVITLIASLWSASKGLHAITNHAITNGLNRVHNTYESRTWLSLRLHAMLHTFVFLMIIAVTIGVMVLGKGLGNQIEPYLKKLPGYLVAIYSLRYIIVFLYQVFLFALLYRNTPNLTREKRKEYGFRCQLPGALFCAASWHVLLFAISVYVTDFNGFSIYRGLTQLAIVMIFLYFCMVCLMIGAEINVHFHREIDWFTFRMLPHFIRKRRKNPPTKER